MADDPSKPLIALRALYYATMLASDERGVFTGDKSWLLELLRDVVAHCRSPSAQAFCARYASALCAGDALTALRHTIHFASRCEAAAGGDSPRFAPDTRFVELRSEAEAA